MVVVVFVVVKSVVVKLVQVLLDRFSSHGGCSNAPRLGNCLR